MIANVVLGINVDTVGWIKELKLSVVENIIVLDYDYYGEKINKGSVIYMSSSDALIELKKFDNVKYYKSIYIYPEIREN